MIEIALASDVKYFWGLCVTATSIAVNASREDEILFHIQTEGVEKERLRELAQRLAELNPKASCSFYEISTMQFQKFPAWYGNRIIYARLMLPELLDKSDFVIHCDVDFLWLANIHDLWEMRDDNVILQAPPEGPNIPREEKWFKEHSLPFDAENYICAGLCLFNLKQMRTEHSLQQILSFLNAHPDVLMNEQTALNSCYYHRIRLLSTKWMDCDFAQHFEESEKRVLHFAGGHPPWTVIHGYQTLSYWKAYFCWHRYSSIFLHCTLWTSLRRANSWLRSIVLLFLYVLLHLGILNDKLYNSFWRAIKMIK